MMKHKRTTVVLVTDQLHCENIIAIGAGVAKKNNEELVALTALKPTKNQYNFAAIGYLFEVAKKYSGELNTIYTDDIFDSLSEYLNRYKASHVITGAPKDSSSIVYKLMESCQECEFMAYLDGATVPVPIH